MKQLFVYPTEVKASIGDLVYFLLDGILMQGKVTAYYAYLIPADPFGEIGQAVTPTNIGYVVHYKTPEVEGKQLLADTEIFITKEGLWDSLQQNSVFYEPRKNS